MLKRNALFYLLVVAFLNVPYLTFAAPIVDSVSGVVADGNSIAISGSNFGVGPDVNFFTDFEKGAIDGVHVPTGTNAAEVGSIFLSSGTLGHFESSAHVSGNYSFQTALSGDWSTIMVALPENTTDIYTSYWVYLPAGDQWPGEGDNPSEAINWKMMWIMGKNPDGSFSTVIDDKVVPTMLGYDDGTGLNWMVVGNTQDPNFTKYVNLDITKGAWIRFSCWIKGAMGTGEMKFWQTGSTGTALKNSTINSDTLRVGGSRNYVDFPGYGRVTINSHPTYDDVYIATGSSAQARVEIGENEIYTNCKKLSIITPTSWTDGSIVATLRQGAMPTGTAYVFVIDETGAISDGYPVVIDSGASDTIAPGSPYGLSVF